MAELLVRASGHWKDSWTQGEVNKLNAKDRASYEARTQIGDIIVVKPDNWAWGREECLPIFLVVKLPQVSYESLSHLATALTGEVNGKFQILKRRKYRVPESWVIQQVALGESIVTITLTDKQQLFLDNIITKIS